ncbi:TauD/TfdA family dioxygenase [Pseudoalteromonas sp. MMG022]|uniref:TauD/TfdA family dioxygenase n=1 Tax=Pseudoalteromonas sp. MMG022 TaxID=2909978 RepID=UPI001F42F623|nr:TauD/TfdA family dioxygenase [Pseudoalteromonas sp. MMG022]MCF6437794.1 TauD/TfdA family dioxygenase [Pseudoalteromonas sp. MMG022]
MNNNNNIKPEYKKMSDSPYSPCLIEFDSGSESALDYLYQHTREIENILSSAGAVLVRGGGFNNYQAVEKVSDLFFLEALKYNGEHYPVAENTSVQRPVNYANAEFLLWHNENTFNHSFPAKAIFACELKADVGGQTPIADSREVLNNLDKEVREAFINKQVMYVRKYESHDFLGVGWKTIFNTDDKQTVERLCREKHMSFEWVDGDILITRAVRPAVIEHPVSGELSWINQVLHWHFHCLSPASQEDVKVMFEEERLYPRNCYFGDGSKIPNDYIDHIHAVYKQCQMQFDWQNGDLLLVDNVLKAHARNPYKGERKILVSFGDVITY